ncbi:MAG: flagellar biosynthesis protein FlhF [Lachnospiraceae bacterium]|nr:flagellar biosynthesis protein FlhF [Lachnospiraceae bacterium]
MIIKKFQGKTEEEALEIAKKELGNSVVLMNVKQVKKKGLFSILKPQMVEVTVALEEEQPNHTESLRSAVAAVSEIAQSQVKKEETQKKEPVKRETPNYAQVQREEMRTAEEPAVKKEESGIEEKLNTLQSMLEKQIGQKEEPEEGEKDSNIEFFKLLYNVMMENELNEKYANQLIDDLDRTMKPNMPIDFILSNVYQKMVLKFGKPCTITPAGKGPKVIYFIGPTGVGKTTTIAKLASKLSVEQKKKIALLTADTYRIAAAEQLRTYASILEVPFRVIYTAPEIQNAISDFKDYDYILIDTAGHSHNNVELHSNMKEMIEALDGSVEKEVYLVVSATTKYRDLISIADAYKEMTQYHLIFTKLDETTTLGNLLNLKLYTGAAMSYVTCGQNVPDDIADFNAQETVKLLLGGGRI